MKTPNEIDEVVLNKREAAQFLKISPRTLDIWIMQRKIQVHWQIGRFIVEEEQRDKREAEYGEVILEGIAERLVAELGQGFGIGYLRRMREFYLTSLKQDALCPEFSVNPKRNALCLVLDIQGMSDLLIGHGINK